RKSRKVWTFSPLRGTMDATKDAARPVLRDDPRPDRCRAAKAARRFGGRPSRRAWAFTQRRTPAYRHARARRAGYGAVRTPRAHQAHVRILADGTGPAALSAALRPAAERGAPRG